jgi:Mn2+/Fe2+ NRAMP family transporter
VVRDDLQSLAVKRYGRGAAALLLGSVVVVNLVTIAADLQAGAAGIGLLAGVGSRWLVVPLGAAVAGLLLAGKYGQVVAVLRYLMLGFAAFGAAAVLAHPDWPRLLHASLVPALSLRRDQVAGGLALLGTTLTSYVYVWETIGRGVEEPPDRTASGGGLARARIGAVAGAIFTAVILWCMLVASAATLGRHHQPVASAQDAAGALRPLAGSAAADLFAAGLITSAVIALPVLLATIAHVVGAHFDWRRGLSEGSAAPGASTRSWSRPSGSRWPCPGRDPGGRHAGGRQRDRRARNPGRPSDHGPPGPRSQRHGAAAHLPPAGHRGLGRHCHRRRLRPARHPRRSRGHVLTCPARSQAAVGTA